MKLVKRLALLLVPLLSAGSLFFSVWHLLEIEDEYKNGEDTYRKMEETFIKAPATDTKGAQNEEPETYPGIMIVEDFIRAALTMWKKRNCYSGPELPC